MRLSEKVQFKRCSLLCQWRHEQRGLPGGPGIGGIYVWYLVLVVIFIGLGEVDMSSGVKVNQMVEGQATKGSTNFSGGS